MAGFKGRSPIKQYIPSKPHKWGYKIYCLASDNYLLRFEIYEGKPSETSPYSPVHDLVMRMIEPYQYQSRILYTDNWFTSPTLLSSLQQRGVRLCGSVRTNRKGLPDITAPQIKSLKRGDWIKYTKDQMTLVVWKDQKPLWLLFNHTSSSHTTSLERWNDYGIKVSFSCPQAVYDYFHQARDVDVIGQLHYSYLIGRKSMKPWSRLVWWLIDLCIINAFILYRMKNHDITQLAFRQQLMHSLVDMFRSNRNAVQVSRGANVSVALAKDHYPDLSDRDRDCIQCSSQPHSQRRRSRYICHSCNVHLCIGKCFGAYHARV